MGPLERVEGETPLRSLAACVAQLPAELRIGDQAADRGGELGRVSGLDEQPGLAVENELGHPADSGSDDGQACSHRFQHRDGHALGGAREDEHVGACQQFGNVPSLAEELDAVADSEPSNLGFQRRPVRPFADDECVHGAGREQGETADEGQEILRRLQSADGDEYGPVTIAPGCLRRSDVDGVRDHRCRLRGARARLETPCARVLGHADRHCRQRPHQAIGPVIEGRGCPGVRRERPAVHREDPDRDACEQRGQTPEDAGLRAARMEDVGALAAQQADELREAGGIPQWIDRAPNVSQWEETDAVCCGGFAERAGAVRGNGDIEVTDQRGEQRGDIRLSAADLGEGDEQQHPRPALKGG